MRKICAVVSSRANYSSIKSVLRSVSQNKNLILQIVVGASALIDRFGSAVDLIKKDGFKINNRVHMLIEGETVETMAKSTGMGLLEFPTVFRHLKPDIVLIVGDRFENMAASIAASYMNIPIAHTMGGEVSGTIDESIRHAITKFSHIHFPASKSAKERIIKLGERKENVFLVGCPRIDLAKKVLSDKKSILNEKFLNAGVGDKINFSKPFIIVSQHSVTTEYNDTRHQIESTMKAVNKINIQKIILWPNPDAGSDEISRVFRKFREKNLISNVRFYKNFPPEVYMKLMSQTSCLVGNSSSGIREGAYIGTPVVNIGTRQSNRDRGKNTLDCSYNENDIFKSVNKQIKKNKYKKEYLYGNGSSGKKIAKILEKVKVKIQKQISY